MMAENAPAASVSTVFTSEITAHSLSFSYLFCAQFQAV